MRSLVICFSLAAAVFFLLLFLDAAWSAVCGGGAAYGTCAKAWLGAAACATNGAGTWAVRAAAATWLLTCGSLAAAAANWATEAALPTSAPLRDDVLTVAAAAFGGDSAQIAGATHAMHGAVVIGASAFAAAGGPGIERALAQWAFAYGAALLLRAVSVRATLLPDPGGHSSPPPDKSALARALTHPAATRNDMLPSGHMLLVGVTAVLAPAARARPALAAAWATLSAFLTLRARVHYSVDILLGLALGALLGVAMREIELPCGA